MTYQLHVSGNVVVAIIRLDIIYRKIIVSISVGKGERDLVYTKSVGVCVCVCVQMVKNRAYNMCYPVCLRQ